MKKIMSGFIALLLITPYLFLLYHLTRVFYLSLLSCSGFFEMLGTALLLMFFAFIMAIAGYMLSIFSYSSIKNNK
jgi:hypothetical protein